MAFFLFIEERDDAFHCVWVDTHKHIYVQNRGTEWVIEIKTDIMTMKQQQLLQQQIQVLLKQNMNEKIRTFNVL